MTPPTRYRLFLMPDTCIISVSHKKLTFVGIAVRRRSHNFALQGIYGTDHGSRKLEFEISKDLRGFPEAFAYFILFSNVTDDNVDS